MDRNEDDWRTFWVTALGVLFLSPLVFYMTSAAAPSIHCSKPGAFKPLNDTQKSECHNCDFYLCLFYQKQNVWFVYPQNCTNPSGNATWVYSFDQSSGKCQLNETAVAPPPGG